MTKVENERKYFWGLMENILRKNGQPFKIYPAMGQGKYRHYAHISKGNGASLSVDFLATEGIFRIALYIDDNETLYEFLKSKKDFLEETLGFSLVFADGQKNQEVKWVKREWSFERYNWSDYRKIIQNTLPQVKKFVEVFERFTK